MPSWDPRRARRPTPRGLWLLIVVATLLGVLAGSAAPSVDAAIAWWGILALSPIVVSGLRR